MTNEERICKLERHTFITALAAAGVHEERICKLERRTKIQSMVIVVGIVLAVSSAAAPRLRDVKFDVVTANQLIVHEDVYIGNLNERTYISKDRIFCENKKERTRASLLAGVISFDERNQHLGITARGISFFDGKGKAKVSMIYSAKNNFYVLKYDGKSQQAKQFSHSFRLD